MLSAAFGMLRGQGGLGGGGGERSKRGARLRQRTHCHTRTHARTHARTHRLVSHDAVLLPCVASTSLTLAADAGAGGLAARAMPRARAVIIVRVGMA